MSTQATPRALARERTLARIVELGNAQLATSGVAGLSVRECARGLGMVSSAIYRYVASRDELLTLLIVDAYEDLAGAVDAALADAGADPRERFLALGDAMCAWAIAHPERWTLLYGTPVRDYAAPAETTNAAGTRVMEAVLVIAADAAARREVDGVDSADGTRLDLTPPVTSLLEGHLAEFGVETTASTEFLALTAWSSLVGVISAHVFGQLGPDAVAVGEQILRTQVRVLADLVAR
jgi:AcrR family transcriptional regulator